VDPVPKRPGAHTHVESRRDQHDHGVQGCDPVENQPPL
jgi:hypothetical protein